MKTLLIGVETTKREIYLIQSVSLKNWSECVELNLEEEEINRCFKTRTFHAYTKLSDAKTIAEMLNETDEHNVYFIKTVKLF